MINRVLKQILNWGTGSHVSKPSLTLQALSTRSWSYGTRPINVNLGCQRSQRNGLWKTSRWRRVGLQRFWDPWHIGDQLSLHTFVIRWWGRKWPKWNSSDHGPIIFIMLVVVSSLHSKIKCGTQNAVENPMASPKKKSQTWNSLCQGTERHWPPTTMALSDQQPSVEVQLPKTQCPRWEQAPNSRHATHQSWNATRLTEHPNNEWTHFSLYMT